MSSVFILSAYFIKTLWPKKLNVKLTDLTANNNSTIGEHKNLIKFHEISKLEATLKMLIEDVNDKREFIDTIKSKPNPSRLNLQLQRKM